MTTPSTKAIRPVDDDAPAKEPAAAPQRKTKVAYVALAVGVAAMLAAIGVYAFVTRNQETTDDAQIEADVVPVAPRAAGQLLRLYVKENQPVKKGEPIFELDDADFSARLEQAQAELATTQAQAKVAEAQEQIVAATSTGGLRTAKAMVSGSSVAVAGAEAQIAGARAAIERAQADVKRTALELSRAQELRAANAVSQEKLDNAQIAADSARAALEQANANLVAAQEARRGAESRVAEAEGRLAQSSPIEAQMAAAHAAADLARAKVRVAEATVKLAGLQLSYTRVVAPEDGIVSKITAHEGALVGVGQPVAELVPDRTYVVANFKETQLDRMRPGQRALVEVDALPHRPLEGRVESLSGATGARFSLMAPDNASGNFVKVVQRVPVRIAWVNPPADLRLKAGLSTTVTVHLEEQ